MMDPFFTQVLLTSFINPHLHLSLQSETLLISSSIDEFPTYYLHPSYNIQNLTFYYLLFYSQHFLWAKARQGAMVGLHYSLQSHVKIFLEKFE